MNEPTPRTDALAEKLTPLAATLTIATAETVIRQILTELLLHSHTLERELAEYKRAHDLNRINFELGQKELAQVRAERDEAKHEAESLAYGIYRRNYVTSAPDWKPLKTTTGILSQISNMVAGIQAECDAAIAQVANLRESSDKLIDAIRSVQDWNETYVGECIDEIEALAATKGDK